MSKGFKSGVGGMLVNFKVVSGTSAPELPMENTIWVNTDTDISGWEFSAVETGNPAEGMVWFAVAEKSPAAFNALKKNTIRICPVSAKQYLESAWVDVDAFIFKNGAWVHIGSGLFYIINGSAAPDYTGGWTGTGSSSNGTLSVINGLSNGWISGKNLCSELAIDMSRYSTMHIVVTKYISSGSIGIGTTNEIGKYDASISVGEAKEYTIDVSGIDGEYYVKLASIGKQNSTSDYVSIGFSVSQIWLE